MLREERRFTLGLPSHSLPLLLSWLLPSCACPFFSSVCFHLRARGVVYLFRAQGPVLVLPSLPSPPVSPFFPVFVVSAPFLSALFTPLFRCFLSDIPLCLVSYPAFLSLQDALFAEAFGLSVTTCWDVGCEPACMALDIIWEGGVVNSRAPGSRGDRPCAKEFCRGECVGIGREPRSRASKREGRSWLGAKDGRERYRLFLYADVVGHRVRPPFFGLHCFPPSASCLLWSSAPRSLP